MMNDIEMSSPVDGTHVSELDSSESVLALLEETKSSSKELGLQQLDKIVDYFWPEIVDNLPLLEDLYQDKGFKFRKLASLVISKVYYHMEEYTQALQYALNAGEYFNTTQYSEYTNIMLAKAVEEFIKVNVSKYEQNDKFQHQFDSTTLGIIILTLITHLSYSVTHLSYSVTHLSYSVTHSYSKSLELLVINMMYNSVSCGEEYQAMGIALDSRRIDLVLKIFESNSRVSKLLNYTIGLLSNVTSKTFRDLVYEKLRDILFESVSLLELNFSNLCVCLYQLNDYERMASLLNELILTGNHLKAFQIAYDLVDIGDQKFLKSVQQSNSLNNNSLMLERLKYILSGTSTIELYLQFLHRKNHTDLRLLEQIMTSVDQRNSITHNAIVISHALMQAGTCCDTFLRDNLTWLSKANNWSKFTATASIGVIHKGFTNESKKVLSSYLPTESGGGSYSEGGSLYALGLIHSNHFDLSAKELLLNSLRNEGAEESVHHGAALGLGLVCMGQCDYELYEELKGVMFRNSAVPGQAAAIAIGLLMLGSGNENVVDELYTFSYETQHEKIIRACVIAIAMILYQREKHADVIISKLCRDNDSIIRYGGMFCYAMAYCGTGSSYAVKQLLYSAVSDVSDDVRRAAVISLGFVLCNTPNQVPKVLKLLSASYNPHVRYGVTIALGVSCAASGTSEATKILQTLSTDRSEFVRQGNTIVKTLVNCVTRAFIGWGLVLQQSSYESANDVMSVTENYLSVICDKHQDVMARFGAILGLGLMSAGGQNCVASLYTVRGNMRREAVVGFLMFTQMWYWHSYIHFVCLTFQPTCLIGLTEDLRVPIGYKVLCSAPPKLFDYIPHLSKTFSQDKKDEVTAVLSISAKRNAWLSNKTHPEPEPEKATKTDDSSSILSDGKSLRAEISSIAATMGHSSRDSSADSSVDNNEDISIMNNEDISIISDSGDGTVSKMGIYNSGLEGLKSKHFESFTTQLDNPCRMLPKQAVFCTCKDSRYEPVFPDRNYGITLLIDHCPGEHEEYLVYDSSQPEAPPFTPFILDN
ncbi:26S proteasome regulatory subunit, putative [Theileria annulata]|uniref:26S proteasome regulatory subunit, putative n=1 Tax=Theileria annulata TaxID=5874 RepID=Q4U9P2_THEAN|nr:26S proteasome regulatory subunit, putative [Theileria annulata]CAI76461.1 26S proteasome regulatory subunit, putative [Theileria annulata]|eukprot:XP_953086.1 26S proteasome regulatory subunit, putative [Theileria annulata]